MSAQEGGGLPLAVESAISKWGCSPAGTDACARMWDEMEAAILAYGRECERRGIEQHRHLQDSIRLVLTWTIAQDVRAELERALLESER